MSTGSIVGGIIGAVIGAYFQNPQLGYMIGPASGGSISAQEMTDHSIPTPQEGPIL